MIQIIDVRNNKNIDKFNAAAKKARDHPDTHGLLVKIYADWCGHCQTMKADWKRVTDELKTNYRCKKTGCTLTIANIRAENLEKNDPVIQKLNYIPKDIHGVPLIMYVIKGTRGLEYSNERTYEEMLKWVINHPDFILERKSETSSQQPKTHNDKPLKGITKKAKAKFRNFHRHTLKRFHKQMKQQHQKSVKSRVATPLVKNSNSQEYYPAYLR
jgi:thiol-disulfide isomerase/thioredoxin